MNLQRTFFFFREICLKLKFCTFHKSLGDLVTYYASTCRTNLIFLHDIVFCLDVAGSKSGRPSGGYSRGGKRREPQNSSLSATNPRRPPPRGARGGGWKQPPSRGYPPQYGGSAVAEEDEIEVGSLFNYGSKKQVSNIYPSIFKFVS